MQEDRQAKQVSVQIIVMLIWVLFPSLVFSAPIASVNISATSAPLRGEDVILTVLIENTGDQIGYFPYIRFILPSQLTSPTIEDDCGGLGNPQLTSSGTSGTADPYNTEVITLGGGQRVVYLVPPVAQLTPSQPAISCKVRVNATSASFFQVTSVRSIFAYGNAVNGEARACGGGGATICSTTDTENISPKYVNVTTSASPQVPSGTGPQQTVSVTTLADVAAGQTLNNVTITDVLPDSFVISDIGDCSSIIVTPAPTTCSFTANAGAADGGTVSVNYTSLSSDVSISYSGYIRDVNDGASNVISPTSGAKTTSQNSVTFNSTETGNVIPSQQATFEQRSIHVTKSVTVDTELPGGKAGFSPGDVIEWTYKMAISDYFQFENIVIVDDLQDGQTFENSSLVVTVSENTSNTVATESNLETQGHLTITPNGDGTTTINLDLGAAMLDGFFSFSNGILEGASNFGSPDRATTVTITYRATIDESFVGGPGSVDAGDDINDIVTSVTTNIVGQGGNYNFGADLPLTTTAEIVKVTSYSKALSFVNGGAPGGPPVHLAAIDLVVFKLAVVIPDGGIENFSISDYLPGPVFNTPGGCFSYSAGAASALADGQWTFGTNDPGLVSGNVTPTCDAPNDRVQFDFVDIDLGSGTSDSTVEIYFAVTATTDPIMDGFEFSNGAYMSYLDSQSATVDTLLAAAGFVSDAPKVQINSHTITATDDGNGIISGGNLTGVDADALNTFSISLSNVGNATAQDGVLTIPLPTGYETPSNPTACTEGGAPDCTYNFTADAGCGGAVVEGASDQAQVLLTNVDIAQSGTCNITYQAKLALSSQPAQVITDEASFTWDNGGMSFSPKFDQASTTLKNPTLTVNSVTAPANTKPGDDVDIQVTVTVPDGTSNGFYILIYDNSFITFDDTSNSTVNMTITTQTINASTYYCMINAATFTNNLCFTKDPTSSANLSATGGNLKIDFGQVINGYSGTTNEQMIFDVNTGIVNAGATSGGKVFRADYYWSNPNAGGNLVVSSTNANITIYTPKLTVSKCATAATTAALPVTLADTVGYNVLVRNMGSNLQRAYDIGSIVDTLTTGTKYIGATISAYYCNTGASSKSCTSWDPGAAGCTVVAPAPVGDVTIPVLDNAGNPDIEPDGFYHVTFSADVSCESVADTTGVDLAPNHNDADGYIDGCGLTPLAFASTLDNSIPGIAYSTQDGAGPNGVEGSYTTSTSNTTALNLDHDGDGILNSIEGSGDADGDGVANYLDTDGDDNGIHDTTEASNVSTPVDTDGDGTPDYLDQDDDGDVISDSNEITDSGGNSVDTDADGLVDFRDPDSDNDGLSDGADGSTTDSDSAADGNNAFDKDSDNDGIPDMIENRLASCDDGTGLGTANDGTLHVNEVAACNTPICAGGGCDDDGNGGIEVDELVGGTLPDQDSDGIPNYLDLDSDNDGLPDMYENLLGQMSLVNLQTLDANSNGFIEAVTIPTIQPSELLNIGNALNNTNGVIDNTEALDSDGDGVPNFLDSDSDNDGVPDIIENGRSVYDNGIVNNAVKYGVAEEYDSVADTNLIGVDNQALIDTDGDLSYNYYDVDSDNDGLADWIEAWSANIDTNVVNGAIDSTEFGIGVLGVGNNDAFFNINEYKDTDLDSIPDIFDLDSDGDTIKDEHETDMSDNITSTIVVLYSNVADADSDGTPDYQETDSDNDGYLDTLESGDANLSTAPVDTDADGVPDHQDGDSDADGLDDVDETTVGTSRTNGDSDGDTCQDGCEIFGNLYAGSGVCAYSGLPWSFNGAVGTPVTDPLDADTDDGGTGDCVEAQYAGNPNPRVGNGADDPFQSNDPDGDGLINSGEISAGTDLNNADSDGDGLSDGDEVLTYLTDPLNKDSDSGGVEDGTEIGLGKNPLDASDDDSDGDGLTNNYEEQWGLSPIDSDTNDDCLDDGDEIGPDPSNPKDTDGDGIKDIFDPDNDNDGLLDCEEKSLATDPEINDVGIRGGGGCGTIQNGSGPPAGGSAIISLLLLMLVPLLTLEMKRKVK